MTSVKSPLPITDWFSDFCRDAVNIELSTRRANPEELNTLEKDLQIPLPKSYRAFLQLCDGAEDFLSYHLFSLNELRESVEEYGFKPKENQPVGTDYSYIYQAKPLALLTFATMDLSADLICFDTRYQEDTEYRIVLYDHEVGEVTTIHTSFAEFLQKIALDMTDDLELFLDRDNENESRYEKAEQLCEYWSNRLTT